MSTLLLRLAGPMQSWGTQSRFTVRDTGLEPSKSGVIGLLCAALGRPRQANISDLTDLIMGVRVDREGSLKLDYHTAGGTHRKGDQYGVPTADGKSKRAVTSNRYYLADADFLVGLEGDVGLLSQLDEKLANPVWPLFLGRKSFVPGQPVRLPDGLLPEGELEAALNTYPWRKRGDRDNPPQRLRLVLEDQEGQSSEVRRDQPVSFAERHFALRHVKTHFTTLTPDLIQEDELCSSHA